MFENRLPNSGYNYAISQIFGPSFLKELHSPAGEQKIKDLMFASNLYSESEEWDLNKALELSYNYLKTNYRCEYVYKNEIANQILLKYHNDNSATLLKELASDSSIADIVIINGSTVAYEIKTELDSFDRLPSQITSYKQLYDYVYIVTHSGGVQQLLNKIDNSIGIIVFEESGKLKQVREAGLNIDSFNPAKSVLTLRQSELVKAYTSYVSKLPEMGTALIHAFCYKWYLTLDKMDAHAIFSEALKSRKPSNWQFKLIKNCSPSLKMLFLGKDFSNKFCVSTMNLLGIFE